MKINTEIKYTGTDAYSVFDVSREEKLRVLNYIKYTNDINHKNNTSDFWSDLLNNSFIGFSKNQIILKSGNYFNFSYSLNFFESFHKNIFHKFYKLLKILFKEIYGTIFLKDFGRLESYQIKVKKKILRELKSTNIKYNDKLSDINFLRYIDYFEVLNTANLKLNENNVVLEVGAGMSMSFLILHEEYKIKKFINIDLPQQIIVSFLILSSFTNLKIGLPHEVNKTNLKEFDILLLEPHQKNLIENESIDLVLNVSSFQEMEIDVVNEYLSYIKDKLKFDKYLISVNQINAKYTNANYDDYNLDLYTKEFEKILIGDDNIWVKKEKKFLRKFLKLKK